MLKILSLILITLILVGCSLGTTRPTPTTRLIIVTPTQAAVIDTSAKTPGLDNAATPQGTKAFFLRETPPMLNAQTAANTADFSYSEITYRIDADIGWFFGEIRNQSQSIQVNIEVRINLLNANGAIVASDTSPIDLAYLKAGETAPFQVLFNDNNPPRSFEKISVDVLSKAVNDENTLFYIHSNLSIEESSMQPGSVLNVPVVKGVVFNANDQPIQFPKVIITYYDARGAVIGVNTSFAETDESNIMPADSRTTFESSYTVLSGEVASYRLQAEALRQR